MAQINRFGQALALAMALGLTAAAQSPQGAAFPCARHASVSAPSSRGIGDWRASDLEVVPASKPPVPRESADLGVAPAGLHLERMLPLLESSSAQRAALDGE